MPATAGVDCPKPPTSLNVKTCSTSRFIVGLASLEYRVMIMVMRFRHNSCVGLLKTGP